MVLGGRSRLCGMQAKGCVGRSNRELRGVGRSGGRHGDIDH